MSGTRTAINAYGAYGEPSRTHTGRFGYTGQIHIPEVGLWHYKARAYSPHLGRFLQTDPIGYDDQTNLYAYVGNDPVNMTDPTGLTAQANDEIVVIGGRRRAPSRMIGLTLFSRSVNVGLNLVSYAVTAQPAADGTFCNGKAPCVLTRDEQDIEDPDTLEGATPEEVEAAAKKKGFVNDGATNDPEGTRLRVPGNPAKQVRIMPGKPTRSDPVKTGPYAVISLGTGKPRVVPLAGNPTLPRKKP